MATKYSDFYRTDLVGVPKAQISGNGGSRIIGATYEITAALSANDLIYMVQIPAGFELWHGWILCDDIDTGTATLELDVGISGSAQKFLNSGVLNGSAVTNYNPEGGIIVPFNVAGIPYTPTSATDIIVTVTAAANAGGTGTVNLFVMGNYLPPSRA